MTKPDKIWVNKAFDNGAEWSRDFDKNTVNSQEEYISISSLRAFLESNLIELVEDDISKQNNYMINEILQWLQQEVK